MKNKITKLNSAKKVAQFLEENSLHKRDFAQMIGVTLSYVYNLIDETVPFSTRSTTLERIAIVMEINPEEFEEYKIPQEPLLQDESIELIKGMLKLKKMSTVAFLKSFPRNKRVEIVDMLRGAYPVPIDYKELSMIGQILDMDKDDIFNIWSDRIKQVLEINGMNLKNNSALVNSMLDCVKKYVID